MRLLAVSATASLVVVETRRVREPEPVVGVRTVRPFVCAGEIGLAHHDVGVAVGLRLGRPAQQAVVTGVGDEQQVVVPGDVVRPAEASRSGRRAAVLLTRRRHRAARARRRPAGRVRECRCATQNPTIAGVGHPEGRSDDRDPERPVEARRRTLPAPVLAHRRRVGLSEHQIGCDVAGFGHACSTPEFGGASRRPRSGGPRAPGLRWAGSCRVRVRGRRRRGPRSRRPAGRAPHRRVARRSRACRARSAPDGCRSRRRPGVVPRRTPHAGSTSRPSTDSPAAAPGRRAPGRPATVRVPSRRCGRPRGRRRDGPQPTGAAGPATFGRGVVPDGVSAHAVTRTQTSPSSTRNGSCSSCAPGALRHSPDVAS